MKKTVLYIFLNALIVFNLISCGSSSSNSTTVSETKTLTGTSFKEIGDDSNLVFETASVSGTGSIVFSDSFGQTASGKNLKISFKLNDGSSLTLFGYSDTLNQNGIECKFIRSGNSLSFTLSSGADSKTFTDEFSSIDASATMQFVIDIHNNETPAHVLIWEEGVGGDLDESNSLINSEDDMADVWASQVGLGNFGGVEFKDAELTSITIGEPVFEE